MLEAKPDTYGWAKERVLRTMLDPEFGLPARQSLNRIAVETQTAYGWVHRTWSDLVSAGAVAKFPDGSQLIHPRQAFDYWLQHRPRRTFRNFHVIGALELLRSFALRPDLEYVATTYLAENLVQGHLFPRRLDIYVKPSQLEAWSNELTTRGVRIGTTKPEDQGIIRLIAADESLSDEVAPIPDRALQRRHLQPIHGFWVVRPPLLIVDLLEEGGAASEAADMLIRKTYAHATLHRP